MLIRPCRADDLEALEQAEPTDRNRFHRVKLERQERGEGTYLIACDGDLPLGHGEVRWTGCAAPEVRSAYPECPEINGLLVYRLRGRGIGTALITAAEDLARNRGHTMIGLGAGDDDPRPRALYERLGYRPVLDYLDVWPYLDDAGVNTLIKDPCTFLVKELSS
jgi:GNAT superfamily N-acetyltransferase